MIGTELLDVLQDRLEVVDRLRIALRLPRHAVGAQEIRHFLGVVVIEEAHAATVEPGVADHFELLLQRPFLTVGTPALHGPQRLVYE